ncbi:MAG TPA: hypothetical protein P5556_10965 [Candidatus Gastranaerophilales bacterium]|nr:hypothetical protein [Candidatus Gastranaerophilales bacterium]
MSRKIAAILACFTSLIVGAVVLLSSMTFDYYSLFNAVKFGIFGALAAGIFGYFIGKIFEKPGRKSGRK